MVFKSNADRGFLKAHMLVTFVTKIFHPNIDSEARFERLFNHCPGKLTNILLASCEKKKKKPIIQAEAISALLISIKVMITNATVK